MPQFVALGGEVGFVVGVFAGVQRYTLRNFKAQRFERCYLAWIVCQKAQGMNLQVVEHGPAHRIAARIGGKAEFFIGLYSVGAAILQMIGLDLVAKAYVAAFLPQIENHAAAFARDAPHGLFKLRSAVAAQAEQGIACQAFGVHAAQHGLMGRRRRPQCCLARAR